MLLGFWFFWRRCELGCLILLLLLLFFFAEDFVNVIVDCGAVPVLVRHLQAPVMAIDGSGASLPFEHEVEKGSALALGLIAVKVIYHHACFSFPRSQLVLSYLWTSFRSS